MSLHTTRGRRGGATLAFVAGPLVGVVILIVVWPAITASGMLAQRDLLVLPRIDVPRSVYWMGPDLGRRLPTFAGLAAVATLVGGLVTGRAVMILSLFAAGWGMSRLIWDVLTTHAGPTDRRPTPRPLQLAMLAALGGSTLVVLPFSLTRATVGHWTTVWALASAPYVLRAIARGGEPSRSRAVTSAALLGMVAGVSSFILLAGATRDPTRPGGLSRAWSMVRPWSSRHAVWILPGLFLQLQGFTTLSDPTAFRPRFNSIAQVISLVVGRGYWDDGAEVVRGHDIIVAAAALLLIALASAGWRLLPRALRGSVLTGISVGYLAPLAAAAPLTRSAVGHLVSTPIGAPLREPHRLVALAIVPMVLLAVLGIVEVGTWASRRQVAVTTSAAIGLVLLASGMLLMALPTVHRRLEPIPVPNSWLDAAALVDHEGGVVLALPWSEYVLLDLDRPRPVYHPLADVFGPDTLASSDPSLGKAVNEAADPRASMAAVAARALLDGQFPADRLRELRVRWIAVLKVEEASDLDISGVSGVRREISSESLDLYRILDAPDPSPTRLVPPVLTGAGGETDVPWTWGWFDGPLRVAGRTAGGYVRADGIAVFVPALLGLALLGWTLRCLTRPGRCGSSACQEPDDQ